MERIGSLDKPNTTTENLCHNNFSAQSKTSKNKLNCTNKISKVNQIKPKDTKFLKII